MSAINPLKPNDPYRGRTAPLTSKRWILYIYSTIIGTEYFKHGIYIPFFSLQNAVCFIILTYLVPVLFTFYIQSVLKLSGLAQFNGHRGSFSGVNQQTRYFEGKNEWSYNLLPPYALMAWTSTTVPCTGFDITVYLPRPSAHHVTNTKPNSRVSSILKSTDFSSVYRNKLFVKIA